MQQTYREFFVETSSIALAASQRLQADKHGRKGDFRWRNLLDCATWSLVQSGRSCRSAKAMAPTAAAGKRAFRTRIHSFTSEMFIASTTTINSSPFAGAEAK